MALSQFQGLGAGANDNVFAQVDRSHQASRVSLRPLEHDAGGHYRVASRSGALTSATVTAGGPLFAFRWTTAGFVALIHRVRAQYVPTVAFTAQQELGLDMVRVSSWTTADTAGTNLTPTLMRKSMMADPNGGTTNLQIATTTILTAGVRAVDLAAIEVGGGLVNVVNPAAGTAYVNPSSGGTPQFGFDYEAHIERGEHPLTLGVSEGFLIRNTVAFPAAGTATLIVNVVYSLIPVASGLIVSAT